MKCPDELLKQELDTNTFNQLGSACLLEATHRPLPEQVRVRYAAVLTARPACSVAGECRMRAFVETRSNR